MIEIYKWGIARQRFQCNIIFSGISRQNRVSSACVSQPDRALPRREFITYEECTMSNGDKRNLKVRVDAVQLNLEALLKLLGGTADDRERFFEIILGITSLAVFSLVEADLENIS